MIFKQLNNYQQSQATNQAICLYTYCDINQELKLETVSLVLLIMAPDSGSDFYLIGALHRFQQYTGHIMTGNWEGRGNQYIQLVKVLYCKLPTNGKQLPAFPLEVGPGTEPRSQRWEARVLPLCHSGP